MVAVTPTSVTLKAARTTNLARLNLGAYTTGSILSLEGTIVQGDAVAAPTSGSRTLLPGTAGYQKLGAPASNLTFSNLANYNYDLYRCEFHIYITDSNTWKVQPNSADTNCIANIRTNANGTEFPSLVSFLHLASSGEAGKVLVSGWFEVEAKVGQRRGFEAVVKVYDANSGAPRTSRFCTSVGFWDDTATVLNNLNLTATTALGLAANTEAWLYGVTR